MRDRNYLKRDKELLILKLVVLFLVRNCESIISKRNEVNIEIHKYKSRIEI